MRNIFSAFITCLLIVSTGLAQIVDPVSWSFTVEVNGDEATLISTATIDEGWHVYAQVLESDMGPVPTEFTFEPTKNYKLTGKNEESKTYQEYDKNFEMNLSYFKSTAVFKQKIKRLSKDKFTVKGSVYFMVCNDEKCLPPTDEPFEFIIPATVQAAATTEEVIAPSFSINNDSPIEEQPVDEKKNDNNGLLEPVKWSFSTVKISETEYDVIAKATIEPHWHVYASTLSKEGDAIPTEFNIEENKDVLSVSPIQDIGTVITEFDKNFDMDLDYFENTLSLKRRVTIKEGTNPILKGEVYFMVCDDEKCLPPTSIALEIDVKQNKIIDKNNKVDYLEDSSIIPELENFDLDNPVNECGGESDEIGTKSIWMIFLLGLGGGLFSILTPCVYPMIPLTVSFFTKGGQDKGKGLGRAALYGLFIILIYVSLSIPFHVSDMDSDVLNKIATSPILNLVFFAVFVFFAFSFLGYYELTLPSKWSNSSDSASNKGGFIGIFFMALTLALVSFSCTGPILGSVLAGVLKDGAWPLTAALGGFGLALGLPFAIFAAFPSLMKSIPQSGGWLNTVKVVLGFLELGLALKFLSNADLVEQWGLLRRETFFAIWILLGVGLALYLFNLIRFPHDSKNRKLGFPKIAFGLLVIAFVIYLIPGVTCGEQANRRLVSGFPPPMSYSFCAAGDESFTDEESTHIKTYKDFEEGRKVAIEAGKPILLDFTGWACVSCREVEENIWTDSVVNKLIKDDYILISLYVDDRRELPSDEQGVIPITYDNGKVKDKQIKTIGDKWSTFETLAFKNNSQPRYALLSPKGRLLTNPISYKDIRENGNAPYYADFLRCGLRAFDKVKD